MYKRQIEDRNVQYAMMACGYVDAIAAHETGIEESKYMLGNTGYSLAQISELMGFSSPVSYTHLRYPSQRWCP